MPVPGLSGDKVCPCPITERTTRPEGSQAQGDRTVTADTTVTRSRVLGSRVCTTAHTFVMMRVSAPCLYHSWNVYGTAPTSVFRPLPQAQGKLALTPVASLVL
jgi:hypothetical protein